MTDATDAAAPSRPKTPKTQYSVVLAICGSIAAYKAVEVARLLIKRGIRVRPIMTAAATRFVGPPTLSGICGEPVYSDMFAPELSGELHVALGAEADVIAIVPATADLLAALVQGRADDLVRATALSARCPVVAAPAMHPRMWQHPATQRNVAQLAEDGRVALIGPVAGEVASGDAGMGRMAEPADIVEAIAARLVARDLDGLHVVVSAGPTVEDIDPARYLSNRSSGKMGFAIAERAAARGARVTLVAGPVALSTPAGVGRLDVRSAREMGEALAAAIAGADVLVMTAAVADFRPAEQQPTKIKRGGRKELTLELVSNPDLLAEIGAARRGPKPYLVGFALETADDDAMVEVARKKLRDKKVDLVVANHAADAFERDDNRAVLVSEAAAQSLPRMSKRELADRILDRVLEAMG